MAKRRPRGRCYANAANEARLARRYTESVFDVVESLVPLAEAKDCTLSQFALAWCVDQPGVTSPIIGPRTMEQLKDNLGALEVDVTAEDRQRIDELVPPGRMVSPVLRGRFWPQSASSRCLSSIDCTGNGLNKDSDNLYTVSRIGYRLQPSKYPSNYTSYP